MPGVASILLDSTLLHRVPITAPACARLSILTVITVFETCLIFSVADPEPEPDPLESETFGRIRIRSGSEINILDPDSNPDPKPDPKLDPKQICQKDSYF